MQKTSIYCEIINNDDWAEVDDPNDLSLAEFQFNSNNKTQLLQNSMVDIELLQTIFALLEICIFQQKQ